jgi:hypothetical protein
MYGNDCTQKNKCGGEADQAATPEHIAQGGTEASGQTVPGGENIGCSQTKGCTCKKTSRNQEGELWPENFWIRG